MSTPGPFGSSRTLSIVSLNVPSDPSPNSSSNSVLNRSKAVFISQFRLVKLTTSRDTQSGGASGLALGKSSMPIAFSKGLGA